MCFSFPTKARAKDPLRGQSQSRPRSYGPTVYDNWQLFLKILCLHYFSWLITQDYQGQLTLHSITLKHRRRAANSLLNGFWSSYAPYLQKYYYDSLPFNTHTSVFDNQFFLKRTYLVLKEKTHRSHIVQSFRFTRAINNVTLCHRWLLFTFFTLSNFSFGCKIVNFCIT